MLFLRSARSLSIMRRLALIAVGAAVATLLLLPAAAAWLRQPAALPLPNPLDLEIDRTERDARAGDRRVRSRLFSRSQERAYVPQSRPAKPEARAVLLVAAPVRATSTATPDEDDESDDSDDAPGGHGDGELGDD
jgi:hypothetical protein